MSESEQLKELLEDRKWRLNHLYWITDKNGQLIRFRMKDEQESFYDSIWYRNDILKARQLGFSTLIALLILDAMIYNSNFSAGIIDRTIPDAQQKLGKINLAYDMLDYLPMDPTDEDIALAHVGAEIKKWCPVESKSKTEMCFKNGSSVKVGMSMRGRTLQLLHVSEMGYVSIHDPMRAREILTGAINSVPVDGIVIRESTHEGGRFGLNYEMTKKAMEMSGRDLSQLDFKFFFFPWWRSPEYQLPVNGEVRMTEDQRRYFASLKEAGIELSMEQIAWYVSMERTQGYSMRQEYPSTPAEAFDKQAEGAIYGATFDRLREQGRLNCRFEFDKVAPFYVSFDIGMSDAMSIWAFQEMMTEHRVLDHFQASNEDLGFYVQLLREWERKYGMIRTVFLPHDAVKRDWEKTSFEQRLRDAGFVTKVVPRTPDVWQGISSTRDLLKDCVFHERCGEPVVANGVEYISGLNAMMNYRSQPPGINGVLREMPLHDICSHSADAFRTFAEAFANGMVNPYQVHEERRKPKTPKTGPGALRLKWR